MKIVGGCQEIGISRLTFCVSCEEGFGRLGVQTEKVTTTMAPGIKLPTPRGLMIIDLDENGAAKAAGMRTGDIILMMNGIEINQPDELAQIFAKTSPDKGIDVPINRNGTDKNFSVVLGP